MAKLHSTKADHAIKNTAQEKTQLINNLIALTFKERFLIPLPFPALTLYLC